LQNEANKIGVILEKKKNLSDEERQYLKDLKKCMLDKKRGFRKPVKSAEKEAYLQYVCEQILQEQQILQKKGGVNHNLSLVKGRATVSTQVVDKELQKKQNEIIRKRMLMMNKTIKHQKLPTIPEYKGGKKSAKKSAKKSWK